MDYDQFWPNFNKNHSNNLKPLKMPTTCGFPNCKFRSRYRGQEDNRHFYRIPKRPAVLRQAWLNAISRSEETVVSQLRICSAHFYGGEKHEGDIPVADPQVDSPEFIELPPKESRTSERRTRLKAPSSSSSTPASMLISPSADRPQLPSIVRPNRRFHRGGTSLFPYGRFGGQIPGTAFGHQRAPEIGNIFANPSTSCTLSGPLLPSQNCNSDPFSAANFALFTSLFSGKISSPNFHPNLLKMAAIHGANQLQNGQKPLVALLDGRDCSIEMPLLKDFATVAFCDAQSINDVHEKVLNEATAALLYQSIYLGREELVKFKALKVVIRIGSGVSNVDARAATELGIAICHTPVECVEETADSTISLILNMFRRTFWMANSIQNGRLMSTNIDQLREQMAGSTRIRGTTLGLIGLGRVGTAVAIRAKAFGFRLLFHDPNLPPGVQNALGMETASTLTELLAKSDCISLHCPLGPENRHLINSENIKSLKFGAFLVNTSDFELIEPNALLAALKSGRIRAAAFDNIHEKGTQKEAFDLLCAQPNVICTGQSSWYSPESFRELREAAAQEVKRALIGPIPENLKHCINKGELIALKRILSFDKFVALNANNSNATNQNSSLFSSSPIFPQFPPLNGHLAKGQIGPNEIGHSISQITSSMRPFNELLNDSMANGHFGGANPLANYPLMMNPQLWQMAFLQNQQQKLATNGPNVERNSSNLEEKSNEALEEKEEENVKDQEGNDTDNYMDEQKDDEELKEDMEEEDGKTVERNEENGKILMEMSKGNNGNVTSEFTTVDILAENEDQKIGNENGIDINENEGEENS